MVQREGEKCTADGLVEVSMLLSSLFLCCHADPCLSWKNTVLISVCGRRLQPGSPSLSFFVPEEVRTGSSDNVWISLCEVAPCRLKQIASTVKDPRDSLLIKSFAWHLVLFDIFGSFSDFAREASHRATVADQRSRMQASVQIGPWARTKRIKQERGRPVKVEEHDIDFRVAVLSQAVAKEAEHLRVQELVKKIESHPHREALQADMQQNNVYNPLSNNSKKMIREFGDVELFELCETIPKVQCAQCLLCWNQGIIYCTRGQFLVESESRRKFHKLRLDALSFPHHVIKKGRPRGARHGKTEEQKEYHIAWNAWKRCCKRVDSQGEHCKGIHDCFLRDQVYRESQLFIGWTEQKVHRHGRNGKARSHVPSLY